MSTSSDNADIVRQVYRDYAAGDLDAACAAMSEDLEWHSPGPQDLPWAGTLRGGDSLPRYLARLAPHLQVERFEVKRIVAQDDWVIGLVEVDVRFLATGRRETLDKVDVFQVRDGKIVSVREHYDTATVLAALGPVAAQAAPASA